MPTQSFLGRTLPKCGAPAHERFTRSPKRQWWCDGIHHHSLECSIGGARRNACCTESTRNTLPHLLATHLQLCQAARRGARGSRISLKVFSRCCWSAKVCIGFARKKGGCVRICWFRSKTFSLMSEAVRWPLSEVVASEWYLWNSCATKRASMWNLLTR